MQGLADGLAETGVWLDGAEFDLADTTQLQDEFDLPPLPLPLHSAGGTGGSGSFGSDPLLLPQPSTEQEKKEKLRASNREKQQRFRQKQREQKKLQQEQFEATEADLERERLANLSLREQHSVMDALRQNQDAAVETLQKAAALDPPPAVACQRALSGAAASTSGGDGGAPGGGASSIRLHAMPFHKRVELCGQLFKSTAPAQLTAEQHGVHDNGQLVDAFGLDVSVQQELGDHVVAAHPQFLEALLHMPQDNILKDWGDFCAFSAELVGRVDRGELGEAEALIALRPAVLYNVIRDAVLMRYRPDAIGSLMHNTKLPGESEEAAAARWGEVALAMNITREQALQLLPPLRQYEQRQKQLADESAASLEALRQVQQRLSDQLLELASGLSPQAAQYLELVDATGQLSSVHYANVYLLLDFYASTSNVVDEMQKARVLAACVPSLNPDVPTIVRVAIERHGLVPEQQQIA
ncbi:hypothetical protein D9Q98_009495 [Chlorella vulgaris]|uniref:BZIP domain-containing protein n=1 Tax=Chlorella vulgaris TaxID=3077 RepID=A0A9D4YSP5_CHLVU|nr:hypothetical protein D9Q98_009495 [Chlorella vulgaris]